MPEGRGLHITPPRPERDANTGLDERGLDGVGVSELRAFSERLVADAVAEVRTAALTSIADLQSALKSSIREELSAGSSRLTLGAARTSTSKRTSKRKASKESIPERVDGLPDLCTVEDAFVKKPAPGETVSSYPPTSSAQLSKETTHSTSTVQSGAGGKLGISHGEAYSRATQTQRKRLQKMVSSRSGHTIGEHQAGSVKRAVLVTVGSNAFNYGMCFVIFLNALTIGYEIEMELRNDTSSTEFLFIAEQLFLVIYVIELSLTLYAFGMQCLWGPGSTWIRFDLVLVVTGTLTSWIVEPLMELIEDPSASDAGESSPIFSFLQQVLIFRMLRILRLARALRMLGYFETLAKFVDGMLSSASTMVSALLVMALTVYVLACVGAELISKSPRLKSGLDSGAIIEDHFRSLPGIVMTLMQFATCDSISAFYVPIIDQSPAHAIFFLTCFLFVSVLLMNLVAAIVLEDALSRSKVDQEREIVILRNKLKKYRPHLEAVFDDIDESSDGYIQLAEVTALTHSERKLPPELENVLQPEMLVDFFEYLDVDGSGSISRDEFVEGVEHLSIAAVPVEIAQIIQLLRDGRHRMINMENDVCTLNASVQYLIEREGIVCKDPNGGDGQRTVVIKSDNMNFSI